MTINPAIQIQCASVSQPEARIAAAARTYPTTGRNSSAPPRTPSANGYGNPKIAIDAL